MIQVIVGTNTNRVTVTVDPNTTPRQLLKSQNIDFSVGALHLDGVTLKVGDLDKTFIELGIKESCFLVLVVKGDGGTH